MKMENHESQDSVVLNRLGSFTFEKEGGFYCIKDCDGKMLWAAEAESQTFSIGDPCLRLLGMHGKLPVIKDYTYGATFWPERGFLEWRQDDFGTVLPIVFNDCYIGEIVWDEKFGFLHYGNGELVDIPLTTHTIYDEVDVTLQVTMRSTGKQIDDDFVSIPLARLRNPENEAFWTIDP